MIKNEGLMDLEKENLSLRKTLRYISHELLNVLTLVDYSVKEVDEAVEEVKENQYWQYITDDVDYMVQLLKELSAYNTCGELTKTKTPVSELIYSITKEMNCKYGDRANIITCVEGSNDDFMANIDKNKIKQVIINLIKNAVEAFDESQEGIVLVNLKREKKWITIEVLDNGCGIDEENLQKIFEEGISINKKCGSGLGLSISKKIIESHRGEIKVNSIPRKGTTFFIKLPIN